MALLSIKNVNTGFGGPLLLDDVSLQIESGERICLMGRNGEGKSTLLRLINRDAVPDSGEIIWQQGIRVALLPQEVPREIQGKVLDVVCGSEIQENTETTEEIRRRAESILSRMKLDPDAGFGELSAGLRRRVFLAKALAGNPDILLLDEPTNHLDIEAILWLEDFLLRHVKTLLFITHDRMFLRKTATRIVELDRGRLFNWACGYSTYLERREAMLESEAAHRGRFDKKLAEEEIWLRQGVKARRTRNEGRVRALLRMREERNSWREKLGSAKMQVQDARRTGKLVIEARDICFAYGKDEIVKDFSTLIMRGDRTGIIGPNGAGKSTLLRILLGELPPGKGEVRHGTHLEIAYFDQLRMQLDEEKTVQDNVAGGNDTVTVNGKSRHIIGYLRDFLFSPERARSPVSVLSGGERNRLLLAKLFTRPSNVLVLDEPTNDLDAETLELLEELLLSYSGTVLLVSHDREFLNNTVTNVLVFEGCGRITEYAGGYDESFHRKPEPSDAPEKTKKKFQREKNSLQSVRRLTFKEQRELESLPEFIEKTEKEISGIHNILADPEFYRKQGTQTANMAEQLGKLERALKAAYERWEELESLPER
ncbi:MAG: ATP-binding cassette domain-containing protein [Desulfococcaceae bacterium]